MSKFDFGFISWFKEDNHDKIWGYFYRPTPNWDSRQAYYNSAGRNCCVFWGRRGKALQFKANITGHDLDKLRESKIKKGYRVIGESQLIAIWPTFEEEADGKLMMEVLAGRVK